MLVHSPSILHVPGIGTGGLDPSARTSTSSKRSWEPEEKVSHAFAAVRHRIGGRRGSEVRAKGHCTQSAAVPRIKGVKDLEPILPAELESVPSARIGQAIIKLPDCIVEVLGT